MFNEKVRFSSCGSVFSEIKKARFRSQLGSFSHREDLRSQLAWQKQPSSLASAAAANNNNSSCPHLLRQVIPMPESHPFESPRVMQLSHHEVTPSLEVRLGEFETRRTRGYVATNADDATMTYLHTSNAVAQQLLCRIFIAPPRFL